MRIMIVEQEIVIVIIFLCSSLGFMVGSVLSPSARMKGKEIGYWRGLTGDYKKQLKNEKKNSSEDDLLGGLLAGGDLDIKTLIKQFTKDPKGSIELLKTGMDIIKNSGQLNQSKLPDYTADDKSRLR